MKIDIKNITKKISQEGNSASILICHKLVDKQLEVIEEIARDILRLGRKKSYKTCPDVFGIWPENIQGKTIKIEQIHSFIKTTQLTPYSHKFKIGIIISVEKATKEAQNALLKTLEEPPKNTFLILSTTSSTKLLPTIVSRCQVIELEDDYKEKFDKKTVESILAANIIKRFEAVESIVKQKNKSQSREEINNLVETLLMYFRKRLLASHKKTPKLQNIFKILKLIETTKLALERNVNQRLALENLMINLPLKGKDF